MSDSLWLHGLYSPWNSLGQNTGVGSYSLLQGIFPTHGSNPGLPHHRWILYQLSHQGSPAAAKSLQSCPILCDPIDGSPPVSPVPRILQARTLEWVAISFSNAWKWKVKMKLLGRPRLLATPRTAAYPGSSVHGIFQARVLEWGAIAFWYILNVIVYQLFLNTCIFLNAYFNFFILFF